MMRKRIGIIGIGNIGSSIVHGLVTAHLEITVDKILISDVDKGKLERFDKYEGAKVKIEVCGGN
ncbi:MAG: NAD(P)-binding domain-containing protein, partial [Candidatus Methanospirareceae archaeon]